MYLLVLIGQMINMIFAYNILPQTNENYQPSITSQKYWHMS